MRPPSLTASRLALECLRFAEGLDDDLSPFLGGEEGQQDLVDAVANLRDRALVVLGRAPAPQKAPMPATEDTERVHFPGVVFPVEEVLQFVAASARSGMVWITTPAETVFLELDGGLVVNASSSAAPLALRLGQILVELECVDQRTIESVLRAHQGERRRLGQILLEEGHITRDELRQALRQQVFQLLRRCFDAPHATVEFSRRAPYRDPDGLELDLTQAILQAAALADRQRDGKHS